MRGKTAHCSRSAQKVNNYASTAPGGKRWAEPSEKQTKAKQKRHADQNTPTMSNLCEMWLGGQAQNIIKSHHWLT